MGLGRDAKPTSIRRLMRVSWRRVQVRSIVNILSRITVAVKLVGKAQREVEPESVKSKAVPSSSQRVVGTR